MLKHHRTRIALLAFLLAVGGVASISPAVASVGLTLDADHVGTVVIQEDGFALDCNGHAIINGGGSTFGVLVDGADLVTVRNCTISGFPVGISVEGSEHATVGDSTLVNNGTGVQLVSAHRNTLRNLQITGSGEPGTFGVLAMHSNENMVSSLQISDHADQQVHLRSSHGNHITDTSATGGEGGFAVLDSEGNTMTGNRAVDYWSVGFTVSEGSSNNRLTDNSASTPGTNGDGFALTQTSGNIVRGNSTSGGAVGYRIQSGAVANDLRNNVSVNPRAVGFYNITSDNVASDGNVFRGNTVIGGNFGFLLRDVSGADVRSNTVTDAAVFGFFLDAGSTSNNTVIGNTAEDIGVAGFEDRTSGSGTEGTANTYRDNECTGSSGPSSPLGIC